MYRACLDLQEITGKISASVTHEIKNQLTVIKEQASLLQDLSLMAARTGGLDQSRVEHLSGRIVERVRQTDAIVRRFNAFAHSSDDPLGSVEAGEALELMAQLYRRLADRAEVGLAYEPPAGAVQIITRPLFLLGALFACLEQAVGAAKAGSRVKMWVDEAGPDILFCFAWGPDGPPPPPELGPSEDLLSVLGARARALNHDSGICLALPRVTVL